jgi:hypothetical protein
VDMMDRASNTWWHDYLPYPLHGTRINMC